MSSVEWWVDEGSRFSRTVPVRMKLSCGMAMIRSRSRSRGIVVRFIPSMNMVPVSISTRRRRTARNVLFPLLNN